MATDIPATMKSPKDKRPGIWREGVLQIWVTRACDKACFGCTQGSNLAGRPGMITVEQFETACQSLEGYWGVVGMFGGNPTMHPQFDQLCEIMRKYIPYEQRGLWCNNLRGKGESARKTFCPAVSNLNVHLDQQAHDEFVRDWPEASAVVKGLHDDSRHSPPYVAMIDVVPNEAERWKLIGNCDVNQFWSAMIGVVRGNLRGYFCEIAAGQAMLHENDPTWPDLGLEVKPGWWNQSIDAFADQVRFHCHRCGIPLRGYGDLAIGGEREQVSATHADIYVPKVRGREVQLVTLRDQLGNVLDRATDYVENGSLPKDGHVDRERQPRSVPGIFGQVHTTQMEVEGLIDAIPPNGTLLEIGSASGGTAALIADARPDVRIVCLDNFCVGTTQESAESRLTNWFKNQRPGMSLWLGTTDQLEQSVNGAFDVVFVDADHSYGGTMQGLSTALKWAKPWGTIAAHDYSDPNHAAVTQAVDDFCRDRQMTIVRKAWSVAMLKRNN